MQYEPDEKILLAEDWKGDDNQNGAVGPHFLVHYQGWKKTWDEWVPETRLLKYNEENLARQKALVEAQKAEAQAAAQSTGHADGGSHATGKRDQRKASGTASGSRGTKRSRESTEHDDSERRPEIKLVLPDSLKVQLVDDWENVTRKEQLVPLPRKPNVREILKEYGDAYRAEHKTKPGESSAVLDEVLSGLKLYFDKSMPQNLLYRFERPQYVEMRKLHGPKMGDGDVGSSGTSRSDTKGRGARKSSAAPAAEDTVQPASLEMEASEIYGAEHLLRLFVNLPGIVAHTSMDAESVALLREHLTAFLAFLAREQKRLFVDAYETPSLAYQRQGAL
ncbi:EAF3 [Malassezia furfur]|nr:EAF3 [Malassezia furfur]